MLPLTTSGDIRWFPRCSWWPAPPSLPTNSALIRERARSDFSSSSPACRFTISGRDSRRRRAKETRTVPIVDVHNHYYPPAYINALRTGPSNVRVTMDDDGNPRLYYPGDYNIAVRGHRDIDYRQSVLAESGVDTQIISLTTPGTHVESPADAARLASLVNDAFARVVSEKGGRFAAYATLPLNDPPASVRELERACTQLGMRGAMLF